MAGRTEIRSLTGLRGVAAIYVMLYHYLSSQRHDARNFLDHGYLAVDLFFVLSGFVMGLIYADEFRETTTLATYLTFLGRRIARVYPLYFCASLVAAACIALGWLEYQGHGLVLDLSLNLLMVQAWLGHANLDGPGWSISAEWFAYLVFPWLAAAVLSKKRWLVIGLCAVAIILVPFSLPADRLLSLGIPVTRCLSSFVLGLFAYRMTLEPRIAALRQIAWLEPVIAILYLIVLSVPHSDFASVILSPVLIFVLSSDRWAVSRMLRTRLLHRLGVLSFSIYLIHDMLATPMSWIHGVANARGFHHGQLIAAAVAIPVSIGLAELACRWIEIPGRRALRHIVRDATPNIAVSQ